MSNSFFIPQDSFENYNNLLMLVDNFQLEDAIALSRQYQIQLSSVDLDQLIEKLKIKECHPNFFIFALRLKTLKRIRKYGLDPEKIIEKVVLPEGYKGKILMVSIHGGILGRIVCLRSGDLWHREILKNTQHELHHLGFKGSQVHQHGGAYVNFEKSDEIQIYGSSDDFGSCDKEYASKLIKNKFKGRRVIVLN